MSPLTASPYWTLLFVVFVSADQKIIKVKSGEDVTLTCRAPNDNVKFLQWSRRDLGDKYVLFYQHGQFVSANQHPSFKNRVDLQDRQMKDGDVSLILKNVTINDAGTYQCHVLMAEMHSWDLISIIYLIVDPPGPKTIRAESGEDVTLTCRAPHNNDNNIKFLQWSRDDLVDKYVLLYRDGHFDPGNKHPSFKNRVDLQDRQMKDGDVSLILKNVTINDAGTYECQVYMAETHSLKIISSIYLVVVPPEPTIITAESGQDVTLTCRAPNNKIIGVVWSRTDKPGFVLFYQDGRFVTDDQHPPFENRVDLQDRQMKDGDVSLILKDVTINDAGTYMCSALMESTGSLKLISIVYLSVPPGILGGFPVWMVALIVCVALLSGTLLFLFLIFIFLTYTKKQEQRIKLRKPVGRSAGFSKLDSESPPAVPRSQSYPTRRKKDDQGQKETDDADLHLQSP